MLSDLIVPMDPRVLIDYRTQDDAGVYEMDRGTALVQTVDFFTPIVDDPYTYGQIAAANAVSDVYAMGGRPITALAIAAFPAADLGQEDMRAIFAGGFDKLREAGVALLGGHTVRDQEVKFGYAVTGLVNPARIWSNAAARAGDVLLLTKPIGTGIVGTAIKFGRAPQALADEAIASMRTLNRAAAETLVQFEEDVHGCTDVTGFGLMGHGAEVAEASGVTLHISAAAVPLFTGVLDHVEQNTPGGGRANRAHFGPRVRFVDPLDPLLRSILFDPQTSGGLLVAVAPTRVEEIRAALADRGILAARVGDVRPRGEHLIEVGA